MRAKKFSFFFLIVFLGFFITSNAQVAVTDIDGYTPNNSAVLDVKSTSRGLLVPRLTTTQMNGISSAADGLLVFNLDMDAFYFYSTAKAGWTAIGSGSGSGDSPWAVGTGGVYLPDLEQRVGIGTDSPASKFEVVGDVSVGIDDPLFEVKNNDNQTVFAVYREGVRMFISDGDEKGTKGGFAVGSLSGKSGENFLIVSPDSTRVYVNEAAAKGTKGGFAVGSLSPTKGAESFLHLTPENYFIGHNAGNSMTTGLYNQFFGYESGFSTTEGDFNVFMGYMTGNHNINGQENVFIGNQAGYWNDYGDANVFIGDQSGAYNEDGFWNIFLGRSSGYWNTSGYANIIIGDFAGYSNETGYDNVFIGDYAGGDNVDGYNNVFVGKDAGNWNISGFNNVFLGAWSGLNNETGNYNVFLGEGSGYSNIIGWANVYIGQKAGYLSDSSKWNVALGTLAGYSNVGGQQNAFLGQESGYSNTQGSYNSFVGTWSGYYNETGNYNVFAGQESGVFNESGDYNTYLGAYAGGSNIDGTNNVCIGYAAGYDETGSNKLYIESNYPSDYTQALIYGDFDIDELRFNADVDIYGNLYYTSDKRWKKNIYSLENSLIKLKKLRGVSYEWRTEEFPDKNFNNGIQIGVIAQEVEEIFPELVKTDKDGYKTVEYAKLTPILIEAIKEQQNQIAELEAEVNRMRKENKIMNLNFQTLKSDIEKLKTSQSTSVSLSGAPN